MKITPYICSINPARVRYTEAQASERGLYLNLKLWNRKRLFIIMFIIFNFFWQFLNSISRGKVV